MSYKEMFFVQTFGISAKNKIVQGRSYPCNSADEATRKAEYLADKVTGVVAFSQMVDETAQDAEEPILLAYHGRVPCEAKIAATAA